jgi:hypothetical protein
MKKESLPVLILPASSPDLSIIETIARPLKRNFHAEKYTTKKAGITRFM